ncbi:MAG: family 10 glycosylhydrolase [Mangrovibacterium sp.]
MNKRDFLKTSLLASAGILAATGCTPAKTKAGEATAERYKHWVWENPNLDDDEQKLSDKYQRFFEAGIRGMFFEHDSEKHFRIAKQAGLETHRWMWTMNRGEKELREQHPDWFAVSRNGQSCATNPPYVDYYRWLCPSKTETQDYLKARVNEILELDYVDGIHLDYVRYCDVILPLDLWKTYNIVQEKELPEYDFCYCDTCRTNFKAEFGTDPLELPYPDASLSWRNYRYARIANVVNQLSEIAAAHNKKITAAVFPTPEVARRNVRQDWTNWKLDGICPMIYHGFYQEPVSWIGDAVNEGVHFLCDRFPLYAGLFLPNFKSADELKEGIQCALQNGAAGVSLFGNVTPEVLATLHQFQSKNNL